MKLVLAIWLSLTIFNSCKTSHFIKFSVEYSALKNKSQAEDMREEYNYYKSDNLLIYVMEKYAFDSSILSKDPNEINESDFRKSKKVVIGHFVYDVESQEKKGLIIPISSTSYKADIDSFFSWNGINTKTEEDNFKNMVMVVEEQLPNQDLLRKFVRKEQAGNLGFTDSLLVFYNKNFKNLSYSVLGAGYSIAGKPAYKTKHIGFIPGQNNQKTGDSFYTVTVEIVKQQLTNKEEETIRQVKKLYESAF